MAMQQLPSQSQPQSQQQANRPLCTFCFHRDKRDFMCYNHTLRDADGNTTCPFLKLIQCRNCFQRGHTTNRCTNPKYMDDVIAEMELAMSMKDPETMTDAERDAEQRKRHYAWHCAFVKKAQYFCSFCYNYDSSDRNYGNYSSHDLRDFSTLKVICPRLLNYTCAKCKEKGHTASHCEDVHKQREELENMEQEELIVDFSDDSDSSDSDSSSDTEENMEMS